MNRNGETPTLTFSSSMEMEMSRGQGLATDNKMEGGGKENNKMQGRESSNSGVEIKSGESGQRQESRETSMNDLPPEMLMEILKCVDFCSLFTCRLVNRLWLEISSGILRNRSNPFTHFEYTEDGFVRDQHEVFPYEKRSLSDFLTCIKNSKNCPFSQFSFWVTDTDDPVEFFKETDFMELTSYFVSSNQTIKCLNLHFDDLKDLQMFKRFTQELRDLLLNKIPRLEELALSFEDSVDAPKVKLFPTPKQTNPEINANPLPVPVQLPHLKVLRFESEMIFSYPEIVKDLLTAAVNLKSISTLVYQLSDLKFLHSLGKLHLLQDVVMTMDKNFFWSNKNYKISTMSLRLPFPKLDSLEFRLVTFGSKKDSFFWSRAANFLANLFESSKDTLKELNTSPIGCFPGLQLPTFTKLWEFGINQGDYFDRQKMFYPGIRSRNVFSTVSHLDLNIEAWDSGFPQEDSIPVFPSVKNLSLNDSKCKGNFISVLTLMCPNLRQLKIHKDNFYHNVEFPPSLNLLNVGRDIWTWMKKLESLEFDVDVDLPENNSFALDSCFTGISTVNCERLYDLKEANKLLNKWGFQSNVPDSVLNVEREHPSILEMRDLKELIINPYSGKKVLKRRVFFTKLTWISEDYAFKFLPHLKPEPNPEE